jgi:hypothetical protein
MRRTNGTSIDMARVNKAEESSQEVSLGVLQSCTSTTMDDMYDYYIVLCNRHWEALAAFVKDKEAGM